MFHIIKHCMSPYRLSLCLISAIPSVIALQDGSRNSIKNGSHIGPMREGQDLQVVCEVYGARPVPVISWHRSGSVVRGEIIKCTQYIEIITAREVN